MYKILRIIKHKIIIREIIIKIVKVVDTNSNIHINSHNNHLIEIQEIQYYQLITINN
jgi:hypothetical protein